MERVESTGNSRFRRHRPARKKEDEGVTPIAAFSRILDEKEVEKSGETVQKYPHDIDASIEELLDSLHNRGDRLKESPTMAHIEEYRQAVSDFIQFIVKHALVAEKIEGSRFHPLKKQYTYTIIRVINEKLDRLAAGILQNQYSQLDILSRVDEINGMVVNLLH
ncbi:MAG: YaaR family protein [Spirochaetota bacterium]|jgi:hypothetical protein|nr:YaaR family protein [Spirochaetota bacterium]